MQKERSQVWGCRRALPRGSSVAGMHALKRGAKLWGGGKTFSWQATPPDENVKEASVNVNGCVAATPESFIYDGKNNKNT